MCGITSLTIGFLAYNANWSFIGGQTITKKGNCEDLSTIFKYGSRSMNWFDQGCQQNQVREKSEVYPGAPRQRKTRTK